MTFKKNVQEWIVAVVMKFRDSNDISVAAFKTMSSAIEYATHEIVTNMDNDGDSELARAEISSRLMDQNFFRGRTCDYYIENTTLSK